MKDRKSHFGNRKELGLVPPVQIAKAIGVTRSAITQADQKIFLKLAHAVAPLSFPPWHMLKYNTPLRRELYPEACRLIVPIMHKIFLEDPTILGKIDTKAIIRVMNNRPGRAGRRKE